LPLLEKGIIPVIPGFIGRTLKGEVTTLGRGGSDVTAFVLARAIKADEVLLVTDVDGVMTVDPKIVANSKVIKNIHARKLMNICDSETKFIHRKALKLFDGSFKARMIRNNKMFDTEGTVINGSFPKTPIRLGHASPVAVMTFVTETHNYFGILSDIFRICNRYSVQVLAWCANNHVICIYLPEARVNEMAKIFHSQIIKNGHKLLMSVRKNLAFIEVVGVESDNSVKILKDLAESFEEKGIKVAGIHVAASEILVFVEWTEKDTALSLVKRICETYDPLTIRSKKFE
jgi:aspartate kinase